MELKRIDACKWTLCITLGELNKMLLESSRDYPFLCSVLDDWFQENSGIDDVEHISVLNVVGELHCAFPDVVTTNPDYCGVQVLDEVIPVDIVPVQPSAWYCSTSSTRRYREKVFEVFLERYPADTELNFIFGYHA